jgi:hypothetical protein
VARHAKALSRRSRVARASALAIVWLGGLGTGFFALLSVAARYTTCSSGARGLACRPAGTAIGGFLVIGVIATVTAVTVLTHDRGPRRSATCGLLGTAALGMCYLAAHALLGTA